MNMGVRVSAAAAFAAALGLANAERAAGQAGCTTNCTSNIIGKRIAGSSVPSPSAAECQARCTANAACYGWVWWSPSVAGSARIHANTCELVGREARFTPGSSLAGLVSGMKPKPAAAMANTPPPQAAAGTRTSTVVANTQWVGWKSETHLGAGNTDSVQQCVQLCIRDRRCKAWSRFPSTWCARFSAVPPKTGPATGSYTGVIRVAPAAPPPAPGTATAPPGRPADPRQLYQAGLDANRRGDNKTAVEYLTQAIDSGRLDPATRIAAIQVRGSSLYNLRRYTEARADYDIVVKAKPTDSNAHWGRASIHLSLGELDAALADADRSVALGPRNASAYWMRAQVREARGDRDGAIADRTQVIALSPDAAGKAKAHVERAQTYRRAARPEDGLKDTELALGLKPDHTEALRWRGLLRNQVGRYAEALSDFEAVLARAPNDYNALLNRALSYLHLGRFAEASTDLARYSAAAPSDAYGHFYRYLARERAGEWGWPDLARAAPRLDLAKWPSPVLHFLLTNLSAADLLAAARHEKPETEREQTCEAEFYIGYAALIAGNKAGARARLERARDLCKPEYAEAMWAKAELGRLAKEP